MPLSKHALEAVLRELQCDCFAFIGGFDAGLKLTEFKPIIKYGAFFKWVERVRPDNLEYLNIAHFQNWLMEYRNAEQRSGAGRNKGAKDAG